MFLSPFIAGVKGLYDRATLSGRVAEAHRKLGIPLLENFENKTKNRFVFVRSILEASLLEKLENSKNKEEKLLLKEKHFERMRKELQMNKQDLEKQNATRADVAVLGIALQEVALCLDEHVEIFKRSGQQEICKFQDQSQDSIFMQKAFQIQTEAQISELIQQFQTGLIELQEKGNKIFLKCQEAQDNFQKLFQEQHRENQCQLELFNRNLQIEFQKLSDKHSNLKRNVLIGGFFSVAIIVALIIFYR